MVCEHEIEEQEDGERMERKMKFDAATGRYIKVDT
jgi:hypothetical protein